MGPSARDLFLSYNSSNRDVVVKVRHALASRGISTFYDRDDLSPGRSWFDELEAAMQQAYGVAVFIGKEGLGTIQRREVQFALTRQAIEEKAGGTFPVIPVVLERADPDAVSGFLALNTWIDLRRGIEDTLALDSFVNAVRRQSGSPRQKPTVAVCPYRGLNAFREEDAFLFFGRQEFSAKVFEQVLRRRLVALVGRSGSGKSSIAKAGLLPLLRRQKPPSDTWEAVVFTPSNRPFHRLAAQLVPLWSPEGRDQTDIITESEKLGSRMAAGEVALGALVDLALRHLPDTTRLIAVVDQFEELFTLTPDQEQRQRFMEQLVAAGRESALTVLVTLRADFYGQAIALNQEFSDLMAAGIVNVGDMTAGDLVEAIEKPAVLSGLRFESGLVDRILERVRRQPGSLPLLEYALTELWQRRQDDVLTHEAYDAIGGVEGAIAQRAQTQFEKLTSAQKEIALPALARLVRLSPPSEERADSRQAVRMSELSEDAQAVMQIFAESHARLVVAGRDSATGDETIEIAHEALIQGWGDLRKWVDDDREFLLWRQQLRPFLEKWRGLPDHKESALLQGIYLAEARQWLHQRPKDLNEEERRFILESEKPSLRARRWMWIAGLAAVSAIVAALLAVVAAAGWSWWIGRDDYQIQATLRAAKKVVPSAKLFDGDPWLAALVYSGKTVEALAEGTAILDKRSRAHALAQTAVALADTGHLIEAVQAAREALGAQGSRFDFMNLASVVEALGKAGHFQEAIETLSRIEPTVNLPSNEGERAVAFAGLAKILADRSQTQLVKGFLARLGNPIANERYLAETARALAGAGQVEYSLQLAEQIKNPALSAYAKDGVAEALAQSGKRDEAAKLARDALHLSRTINKEPDRSYSLNWPVRALVAAGETSEALSTATGIQDQTARAQALIDIAQTLTRFGKPADAIGFAKQVPPQFRSLFYGAVLMSLADAKMAGQALEILKLLEKEGLAVTALVGPVDSSTVVEWLVEARANPKDALAVANEVHEPSKRARALALVAGALKQAGELHEAEQVAKQALADTRADRNRDLKSRVETLSTITEIFGNAGLSNLSESAASLALVTGQAITDDEDRSKALSTIAQAYAKLHSYRRARSVVDQCTQSNDKLAVYAAILRAYTLHRHPELATLFERSE
jgi:tetratricopeptide (TPR) repeat protein